jgi:hypothetical protein
MDSQVFVAKARRLGLCLASGLTILAAFAPPAAAQPQGSGGILVHNGFIRGVDTTYDPSTGGYFVVGGQGHIIGMCVNADGHPISGMMTINDTGFGAFPRARYSPQIGGFLVVWGEEVGNPSEVHARVVTCGGGMGPEQVISGGFNAWIESGAAIAYSNTSQKFLVAWKSLSPSMLRVVLVDNNGGPASGVVTVSAGFGRDPGVAWNPQADEFGVSFSGEDGSTSFSGFVVVPAGNPAAFRRTSFNHFGGGLFTITDLDYVEATGRYLMTWFELSTGAYAKVAQFDAGGNLVSHNVVSSRLGSYDAIAVAYNPVSGSSLLTGLDRSNDAVLGIELNTNGDPGAVNTIDATFLPARYPRTAASRIGPTWMNTYSGGPAGQFGGITNFRASGSGGGAPAPAPPPPTTPPPPPPPTTDPCICPTIQPGVGWVCSNGNWLPPGSTTSCGGGTTPPPPPPGSSCTTIQPDPTWVCDGNGNWLPPGSTPPPPGSTCTTIQPGPNWICVNGNWLPPDSAGGGGTPPPPPPTGSPCLTIQPDPTWVCDGNGNWLPPGSVLLPPPPSGSTCTTIQPDWNWVCVNGNWLPPGSPLIPLPPPPTTVCTTIQPGATWTCDPATGNWLPPGYSYTSACTTIQPGPTWTCDQSTGNWLPPQ